MSFLIILKVNILMYSLHTKMLSGFGVEINGQEAIMYPLRILFTVRHVREQINVNNEFGLTGKVWYWHYKLIRICTVIKQFETFLHSHPHYIDSYFWV
jgi:hypothetical protein